MNKKRVKVGIPTLRCYDKLLRLCDKLLNDEHECIEAEVLIIDNGGVITKNGTVDALHDRCDSSRWQIGEVSYNLGVSKSWNFLVHYLGQCVIANDDVVFGLDDIAAFLKAAEDNQETVIFEANHAVGGFSTFYVNRPDEWMLMGGFDELFSPAYFEDNDCRRRLELVGNPVAKVDLPGWSHDNSSTLHGGDELYKRTHWCCFERNKKYYELKWGGLPGREQFASPFNANGTF